jgi:putative hydrolase of the HAD superfamily
LKLRAVLFDAAETLFTTRGTVGELYAAVARDYGCTAPASQIQEAFVREFRHSGPLTTRGESQWWRDVVERVFNEVGMVDNFEEFFQKVYDQFCDSRGWLLFPETREVLTELKQRGFRLGVISNFDSRVYSVMRSLDILSFFDTVTISSETGYAKPHPGIFLAAREALGLPAARILLVGDSLMDDVQAGQLAGMQTVLIDRQNRHEGLTAYPRITNLREVPPILDQAQE